MMPRVMRDMRLTVGDFASPAQEGKTNPCVMGCAHLYLGSLFVFGEGMGGSEGGRVEGRLAVSAVLAHFRNAEIDDPHERLSAALTHAADVLRTRSRSVSAFTDAWAQAVAVLVRKNRLFAVRCGDVRLLLIRNGQVRDLFDCVPSLTPSAGEESAETLLGQGDVPRIEVLPGEIPLEPGDRFLLSNSPLAEAVQLTDIARYVSSFVPAVAARRLVEASEQGAKHRPISVQIVQSGELPAREFRPEEPIRPRVEPVSGVASMLARSPSLQAVRGENPLWAASKSDQKSAVVSLPKRSFSPPEPQRWAWLAGVAAVGLIAFGLSTWLTADPPSQNEAQELVAAQDAAANSGLMVDEGFWAHMRSDSIPTAAKIRQWAGDKAGRRLAEARAVVAALEASSLAVTEEDTALGSGELSPIADEAPVGLPVDAPFEDIQRGKPSEAAAPGSHPPPKEPVVEEDPLEGAEVVTPTPRAPKRVEPEQKPAQPSQADGEKSWSPRQLPRGIRGLDRLFRSQNIARAGETLRNYIHRRHTRVDKVLSNLDVYLDKAPKERSIAVLKAALKHRPGPKSRRWMRQSLRRLRAKR